MDFWAGYLSGAVSILVGNPLDIIKVRLQARAADAGVSSSALKSLPGGNGAWSEALRGLPAPVLTYGALNALLFTTYNSTLGFMTNSVAQSDLPQSAAPQPTYKAHFAAGVLAGLATFVISAPTELVKCRAQLVSSTAPGPSSSWSIARQTVRLHGVVGLYQGGVVTSIRDAVGYGFYFWTYKASQDIWDRVALDHVGHRENSSANEAAKVLLCGGLAGVATWASIFPLDVIKTRVQTQNYLAMMTPIPPRTPSFNAQASEDDLLLTSLRSGREARLKGALAVAHDAYMMEGAGVFFRGLGVCCIRAFIVNAVQWATYEYIMRSVI